MAKVFPAAGTNGAKSGLNAGARVPAHSRGLPACPAGDKFAMLTPMNALAFLCTGSDSGWNPICNGNDFGLLLFLGVAAGSASTAMMTEGRGPLTKFGVLLLVTPACVALSLVIGLQAMS